MTSSIRSFWSRDRGLLMVAITLPIVLYLGYIVAYAVNVPVRDDWFVIPVVNAAFHGHLTFAALWSQFSNDRLFLDRLIFVAFGFVDHLDEKSIMLFSGLLFAISFLLLLALYRQYSKRTLSALNALILGVVWFSLADVQNALWAFQLAWYLVVFCFSIMVFALLRVEKIPTSYLVVAIVAGVAASLSLISGFLLWPIGGACILWVRPIGKRQIYQFGIWVLAGIATVTAYLPGYRTLYDTCVPRTPKCSETYGVVHPLQFVKFFTLLVGNVVPSSLTQAQYLGARQIFGALVCAAAVAVIVQTVRLRRSQISPLPAVIAGFGLLFDLQIAVGRVGQGLLEAVVDSDRYTMPNLLILFGIAMYVLPRFQRETLPSSGSGRVIAERVLALSLLALFVLTTTWFGLVNGNEQHTANQLLAREVVNLREVPPSQQPCYLGGSLYPLLAEWRTMAANDQLTVFQTGSVDLYRKEGLPKLAACGTNPRT